MQSAVVQGIRCHFVYKYVCLRIEWQHSVGSHMTIPHAGNTECHTDLQVNKI